MIFTRNRNKIYEHKRDLFQKNTLNNTLVTHCNESCNNFNLKNDTLNKRERNILRRKCTESLLIAKSRGDHSKILCENLFFNYCCLKY